LGRAGAGYDHQLSPRIVAGILTDFDISSLEGSLQDGNAALEGRTKATWSWAAGARAGWLVTPAVLTYVNGGYSRVHLTGATMVFQGTAAPFFGLTTPAFELDGWFAGGGVEAPLARGWFWRNEYRYARYETASVPDTSPDPAALVRNNINFQPVIQTVTTQLVFKFGGPR
jgi:outer membrane immunogenic protein